MIEGLEVLIKPSKIVDNKKIQYIKLGKMRVDELLNQFTKSNKKLKQY